eukprot:Hpha_TRINITY_DN15014_c4_g1::TRINITY_DN15014_c4_g1_i1::g.124461::m.124461
MGVYSLLLALAAVRSDVDAVGNLRPSGFASDVEDDSGWSGEPASLDGELRFEPPRMLFGERQAFTAGQGTVRLTNNGNAPISVLRLATSGDAFSAHAQNSPSTPVNVGESTAITVSFNPWEEGPVLAKLLVSTSAGDFVVPLSGQSVPNRFRVHVLSGVGLPVGHTHWQAVEMVNPTESLVVVEMVKATERFLSVALRSPQTGMMGAATAAAAAAAAPLTEVNYSHAGRWELAPMQQRTVAYVRFHPEKPGKYQGLVQIALSDGADSETLHVPVSLQVPDSGVFLRRESVSFGTLTFAGQTRNRKVVAVNSGTLPCRVTDLKVKAGGGGGVKARASAISIRAGTAGEAGVLTVEASKGGKSLGEFSGEAELKLDCGSRGRQSLVIPYSGRVLFGRLEYTPTPTVFLSTADSYGHHSTRPLKLRSTFNMPVHIREAYSTSPFFSIRRPFVPIVIPPGKEREVLAVQLLSRDRGLFAGGNVVLHTNVSQLRVPLQTWHGRLAFKVLPAGQTKVEEASSIEHLAALASEPTTEGSFDFGLLNVPGSRTVHFVLSNPNPVPVRVSKADVQLTTSGRADSGKQPAKLRVSPKGGRWILPGESQVYGAIMTVSAEGEGRGTIAFELNNTNQRMEIKITYAALRGGIAFVEVTDAGDELVLAHDASLEMNNVMSGGHAEVGVAIQSTYRQPLRIVSASSSDPRFEVRLAEERQVTVRPGGRTLLGTVSVQMHDSNSSSQSRSGRKAKKRSDRKSITPEDVDTLKRVLAAQLSQDSAASTVISFATDASAVLTLPVVARIQRRRAIPPVLNLSRVAVGSKASLGMWVDNPTGTEAEMSLFLWHEIQPGIQKELVQLLELEAADVAAAEEQGKDFSVGPLRRVTLQPGAGNRLGTVGYEAKVVGERSTILIVRNPFSVLEASRLVAYGGSAELRFRERTSRAHLNSLQIVVNASHLSRWNTPGSESGMHRGHFLSVKDTIALAMAGTAWMNTTFVVRDNFRSKTPERVSKFQSDPAKFLKTFIAVNTGTYPVNVTSVTLGTPPGRWQQCSVAGLKVEKCGTQGAFYLDAGESGALSLCFVPDFSTDAINTRLYLKTQEQGTLEFPVELTMPRDQVVLLYDTIPHTVNETVSRAVVLMVLVIVGIQLAVIAVFEFVATHNPTLPVIPASSNASNTSAITTAAATPAPAPASTTPSVPTPPDKPLSTTPPPEETTKFSPPRSGDVPGDLLPALQALHAAAQGAMA